MSAERVWLRHADHGGVFHAPAEAVDALAELGWEPGEPPDEHNPVVAENLAAQAAQQEAAAAHAAKKSTSRAADKE